MPVVLLATATHSATPPLAFFQGIGAMEMVLVAIVGLLLFGGKGLPDMARTIGKTIREFKKATSNVENEVRRVMNDEPAPKRRPRPAPPPADNSLPGPRPAAAAPDDPSDEDGHSPRDGIHGPEPRPDTPPPPPAPRPPPPPS